jgi:hyperosmotically inducible protein
MLPLASLPLLFGAGQYALADTASDSNASTTSSSVSTAISDTAITTKVKAQFLDDSRFKDANISVKTNSGVVTLSGTAPSSDSKAAAEDLARHVDGVKDVTNDISSPSLGQTISKDTKTAVKKTEQVSADSWITTKVKSALLADSITKGFRITVSTSHHVVTLSGTVDSQAAADKAVAISRQIRGVQDVNADGLKVGNG